MVIKNPMTVFSRLIIAALEEEGLTVSSEVNCSLPAMVPLTISVGYGSAVLYFHCWNVVMCCYIVEMLHPRDDCIPAKGKVIPLYCLRTRTDASYNYSESTARDSAEVEYRP